MGPPSRVGHTKNLFYNKMNLIHGFGKYNFFGGYRVPLGGSGGTRPPPGWPLWPLSPKAPLEIFLKPLKTFHSNPEKVPRPLVALALAKNLDSVGPRCVFSSDVASMIPKSKAFVLYEAFTFFAPFDGLCNDSHRNASHQP